MEREEIINKLRNNTEASYNAVVNAMNELVDALTAERDFYKEQCKNKENLQK